MKTREALSNVRENLKAKGPLWGTLLAWRLVLSLAGGLTSAWGAWLWMTRPQEHWRLAMFAFCLSLFLVCTEGFLRAAFAVRFGRD